MYKEKGSKFLAFAFPVDDEDKIKIHLSAVKKEFYDARHHCFGWILGEDQSRFRAYDDGEPNHSGGDPILGQIRSKELTNTMVVVVRYFGGKKLGVGGLTTAYKKAAEDALNKCVVVEMETTTRMRLTYAYKATSEIMRAVKDFDLHVFTQQFETSCVMEIDVTNKRRHDFVEHVNLLIALGHAIQYHNVP